MFLEFKLDLELCTVRIYLSLITMGVKLIKLNPRKNYCLTKSRILCALQWKEAK